MRQEILNYYYSVDNVTWFCDKSIIFQSSNNWLSKFMQCYNFTKNKHINEKVEKLGESRIRYQRFHSYFHHMIFTKTFIPLIQTTLYAIMVIHRLTGDNQWTKCHHLLCLDPTTLGIQKLAMDLCVFFPARLWS